MTNDISRSNSLTDIAARIRHEHEAVRFALRHAVERALTSGDLLLEAKEQLPHGQWTQWIQEHCAISERTARLYMRLAKNRAVIEAAGDVADLTLNAAVRLLAPPKEEDENQEDRMEEISDKIAVSEAQLKNHIDRLILVLREVRNHFGEDTEGFEKWMVEISEQTTQPPPDVHLSAEVIPEIQAFFKEMIFDIAGIKLGLGVKEDGFKIGDQKVVLNIYGKNGR